MWWGGNFDELRFLVENELITADNIRFYVGYTGWEAGQLFGEITDGAWIQADGDTNYVFRSFSDNLWSDVLALKSDTFGVIGQIDVDTVWN